MTIGGRPVRRSILGLLVFLSLGIIILSLPATVSAAPTGSKFDHVVILAMENQNYVDVLGDGTSSGCPSGTAPFLCSMLPYSSTIPNYHSYCGGSSDPACSSGIGGCSAACYTAVTSGGTFGVSDGVGAGSVSQTSIFDSMTSAGLTWTEFCESGCPRGPDHSPCLQYATSYNSANCIVMSGPLVGDSQLLSTFNSASPPNFIWITPTDSHNMHDNSISSGDSWAQSLLVGSGSITNPASGSLLSTNLFSNSNFHTLLWIWWDEYDPSPSIQFGKMISKGFVSTSNSWDEYSQLRMIENNWGLPTLSNDAQAPVMSELFGGTNPAGMSASFTYTPASPMTGTSVSFSASASGGTSPYSYSWNFGDGSTGSGATTSHTYNTAGQYTVTLTVTDSASRSATASQTLTVNSSAGPSVSFTYSPSSPSTNSSVSFNATPTGGTPPYSYSWDLGDGGTATGLSATHQYVRAGNYTVTLTITDSAGMSFIRTQQIEIRSTSPPGQPNGQSNGGQTCLLCNATQMVSTLSPLVIGLLGGMTMSTSFFLARYHRQNKRLAAMIVERQKVAALVENGLRRNKRTSMQKKALPSKFAKDQ